MATPLTHAVAALAIGPAFPQRLVPRHTWAVGAALAVAPDLDFIGFRLGIPYESLLGHRGLTHSLPFAALLAGVAVLFLARHDETRRQLPWLWLYLFLATVSHGFLDALTNGGLGIAFFSPLSNHRYFLPVRPVEVSPLGIRAFLTPRAARILGSELLYIWLPAATLATVAWAVHGRRRAGSVTPVA